MSKVRARLGPLTTIGELRGGAIFVDPLTGDRYMKSGYSTTRHHTGIYDLETGFESMTAWLDDDYRVREVILKDVTP